MEILSEHILFLADGGYSELVDLSPFQKHTYSEEDKSGLMNSLITVAFAGNYVN